MDRKKLSFVLLLIFVGVVCLFLLFPSDENETQDDLSPGLPEESLELKNKEDLSEYDENETVPKGINGTYAHYFEEENATVFVFFDEVHGMYIQEIVEMEHGVPVKSAGNYSLHEDEGILVVDGVQKEFKRKGKNLLIDGILYERTQGILLTLN